MTQKSKTAEHGLNIPNDLSDVPTAVVDLLVAELSIGKHPVGNGKQ
jgi:hypothetical protein